MKLAIKEPCQENWDNMKIGMISRHCDVCEKSVMDFTTSSRAEIITYIISNRNESTCGRMHRDQFEFHHEDIPVLIEVLKQKPRNHAFLILALVSLSLSACAQETIIEPTKPPIEKHVMGRIAPPPSPDTTTQKPTCSTVEKGEIEMVGEIAISGNIEPDRPIKGDIAYETTEEIPGAAVMQFAEKMPEYTTGIDGLFNYIQNYFKPKKITTKGSAYVRFIVNHDGTISDPTILNIDSELSYLTKEILEMVLKMPKWIPGENEGKKVKVFYTIPVKFN